MDNTVLLELVKKWREKAVHPKIINGSDEAKEANAYSLGKLDQLDLCADHVEMLVKLIG